jgi:hypothetical protein
MHPASALQEEATCSLHGAAGCCIYNTLQHIYVLQLQPLTAAAKYVGVLGLVHEDVARSVALGACQKGATVMVTVMIIMGLVFWGLGLVVGLITALAVAQQAPMARRQGDVDAVGATWTILGQAVSSS